MQIRLYQHIRFTLPVAALAGAFPLLPGCGDRAAVYMEEGRNYAALYDHERAARKFALVATAFQRSPHAAAARAELARCRAAMHYDRAEELIYRGAAYSAFGEVLAGRRLARDDARGLYLTGLAHLAIGARDLAWQEFNAAALRAPASPYGFLGRAEYYRFALRREEALAEYMRAMRFARGDLRARAAAYRGVRDMAHKLNKPEKEIAALLAEGTTHVPPDAFYYWVGYYYLRKPPVIIADAKFYFTRALTTTSIAIYAARARAGLAECYLFYKEYDDAKKYIDEALAADPENDFYYKIAGKIYKALNLAAPQKRPK